MLSEEDMPVVLAYDELYNRHKLWQKMTWRGHDVAKTPEDMWLYQEAIWQLKPSLIVELGTSLGGTALFFADMLELCGCGQVISVDIKRTVNLPSHPRLNYIVGHCRHDPAVIAIRAAAKSANGPVMIIEDSSHNAENVGGVLEIYHDLVTPGSWFVIEDLNWPCNPNAVQDCVADFLKHHPEFSVDESKDKYLLTLSPGGWLQRK